MKKHFLLAFSFTALTVVQLLAQTKHTVQIVNGQYSPNTLIIAPGDSVMLPANASHPLQQNTETGWFDNASDPFPGGFSSNNNITVGFPDVGNYYYICTAHIDFGMKGLIIVDDVTTGLQANSVNTKSFELYPNPATAEVTVRFSKAEHVEGIQVINLQGTEVSYFNVNYKTTEYKLDLNNLKAGMYQLIVTSGDKKLYNKVVIK